MLPADNAASFFLKEAFICTKPPVPVKTLIFMALMMQKNTYH